MLVFKKVITSAEAEILRNIRNECKDFMTRSTSFITEEQQQAWFKTAHERYDLYIAYSVEHGAVVVDAGYGLIHKDGDVSLLSGGLLPQYRDKGLGSILFKHLIDNCDKKKTIQLEVLNTNTRAYKVYEKLGFKVISTNSKVTFMEYQYDSSI